MINRNIIRCVCETCISDMSLQSVLNKWPLTQLKFFEELYDNAASNRLLKISKR